MAKADSAQYKKGWLAAFLSQGLWGTGGIAIKLVDTAVPSSLLVGLRHGVGTLVLGSILLLRGEIHVLRTLPYFHVIILGIFAAGLPDLLLVEAVRHCGAILAVILARIEIPLGVIFAHLLLKERVHPKAYLAAALSFGGAVLISLKPGASFNSNDGFYLGVMLALLAAVLWALSSTYAKFILNKQTDPLGFSFMRLAIGSAFGFVVAALVVPEPFKALAGIGWESWALIVYLGVFLSGLAYWMFYYSLRILEAHVLAILLSVSIMVVLVLGLLIGERISWSQWLGIGLVVASIIAVKTLPPTDEGAGA